MSGIGTTGLTRELNPSWVGDQASYRTMHMRIRAARGPAKAQRCVDCGERADDWSYDGSDPDERQSPWGAYSLDVMRYQPRCRPDHRCHDKISVLTWPIVREIRARYRAGYGTWLAPVILMGVGVAVGGKFG